MVKFMATVDNMPYNSNEMQSFAKQSGFVIKTSSPHYPQSNGLAEISVKIVKSWLKKDLDLNMCLLEYHNTPVSGLPYSPSQLLMGRICRTKVPINPVSLMPKLPENVQKLLQENQLKQKQFYDRHATERQPFVPGETVQIKKPNSEKWTRGIINTKHEAPRSYLVRTEGNVIYRRTSAHIQRRRENRESNIINENLKDPIKDCNQRTLRLRKNIKMPSRYS